MGRSSVRSNSDYGEIGMDAATRRTKLVKSPYILAKRSRQYAGDATPGAHWSIRPFQGRSRGLDSPPWVAPTAISFDPLRVGYFLGGIMRRRFLAIAAAIISIGSFIGVAHAQQLSEPEKNFEQLWKTYDRNYALFGPKRIDWTCSTKSTGPA
jgi:hypothetical protein